MRADPSGLRNHFEFWQFFNQLAVQMSTFADEHNHLGILEPDGELANPLDCVGINLGRIGVQFGGA